MSAKQSTLGKYTGLLVQAPSFMMWMGRHKFRAYRPGLHGILAKVATWRARTRRLEWSASAGVAGMRFAAGLEKNMIESGGNKVPLVDCCCCLCIQAIWSCQLMSRIRPVPMSMGGQFCTHNALLIDHTLTSGVVRASRNSQVKIETKGEVGGDLPESEGSWEEGARNRAQGIQAWAGTGFAVRGNPDDPQERACLEDSVKQVFELVRAMALRVLIESLFLAIPQNVLYLHTRSCNLFIIPHIQSACLNQHLLPQSCTQDVAGVS